MEWDVKKMDEYDAILTKLDRLLQLNDEKLDNTSLKVKNGQLIAEIDILTVKLEQCDLLLKQIAHTLFMIEEYTRLARTDQNHLPHINRMAKRAIKTIKKELDSDNFVLLDAMQIEKDTSKE